MHFIDDLLLEAEKAEEKQKLEVDKIRADYLLMAIEKLEKQSDEMNKIVDDEVLVYEQYRQAEEDRLQKKIRWFAWNLEQYIRSTGEKTIRLPHGSIKLRARRDKIEIIELEKLINESENHKFLKAIPESFQPDLTAIHSYIKTTGHIPDGVNLITGEVKFSFTTLKRSNSNVTDSEQ